MHLNAIQNPLEYPTRLESKNKVSYDRLVIMYDRAIKNGNAKWAANYLHRLRQCPLPYNCWTPEDRQIELAKVAAKKAGVAYTGPQPTYQTMTVPQYTPPYTAPQYTAPVTAPRAAGFAGWIPLVLAGGAIWFFMYRK